MLPFWHSEPIVIIPDRIELHVFGILVGTGVLLGSWIAQRRAEKVNLNPRVVADLGLWVVLMGFIFAHLVSLFAYFPERVFGNPCASEVDCLIDEVQYVCGANGRCDNGSWLEVLKIWAGISSFGGFLGAFIGLVIFMSVRRIIIIPKVLELEGGRGRPMLKYADTLAYGFAMGWFFGRMGCFSAHDHVGVVSESIFAVPFPNTFRGGDLVHPDYVNNAFTPRLDLGFFEMLWSLAMFVFFSLYALKKQLRPGWYAAMMMILYAPFRFYLDTLRAIDIDGADKRYFADLVAPGITPGQIGAVVVLLAGLTVWFIGGRAARDPEYMAKTDPQPIEELVRSK